MVIAMVMAKEAIVMAHPSQSTVMAAAGDG